MARKAKRRENENIPFYLEWVHLDKKEFRILAMATDAGTFRGNLTDMCRYLSISEQTRNRTELRGSIEALQAQQLLEVGHAGNTYTLTAIKQPTEVLLPRKWLHTLLRREYEQRVAWEVVLKVQIWVWCHQDEIITNAQVINDIGVSESTVTEAKKVLKAHQAIYVRYKFKKVGEGEYRRIGQIVDGSAFWDFD